MINVTIVPISPPAKPTEYGYDEASKTPGTYLPIGDTPFKEYVFVCFGTKERSIFYGIRSNASPDATILIPDPPAWEHVKFHRLHRTRIAVEINLANAMIETVNMVER